MGSIIQGDYHYNGNLSARSMSIPANSIGADAIRSGEVIPATNVENQQVITKALFAHATTVAATRQVIHAVFAANAELISFGVGCTVAPTGADTVTLTLKKDGVSILSGNIVLDSGNGNFDIEDGVLTTTDVVAGDILEVDVTAVSGTTAKGLFARLVVREQPS